MPRGGQNRKGEPDHELQELFEEFDGRLISPGGAAQLLGVTRATVYTLGRDDLPGRERQLRVYRGPRDGGGDGWAWVYIPLEDVYAYAERIGRPIHARRRLTA
jgi:hypothetical protein